MRSDGPPPRRQRWRDLLALARTLARYWVDVFPRTRRELRAWRRRAATIPDPVLRAYARATLHEEGANSEGAALFATLAPGRHRRDVVRALVAFQVMYDYLDTLTEQPVPDLFAASRCLHGALVDALGGIPGSDYYACLPWREDGGYLAALVLTVRLALARLPGTTAVAPLAQAAALRSAEGQTYNHAAMLGAIDRHALVGWSERQAQAAWALRWFEVAAAAGSSLVVHALIASAAQDGMTPAAAAQVEAAYWPWVAALNTLLESLVDAPADAISANHSYYGHYASEALAAERLASIAERAATAARALPPGRQHAVFVAAMACFYLSAPELRTGEDAIVARRILEQVQVGTAPLMAVLRLRRRLGS